MVKNMFRKRYIILFLSVIFQLVLFSSKGICQRQSELADERGVIAERFLNMTRDSDWELISSDLLQFQTYHTQGMTKVGDFFYMSSVEIITPTERVSDSGSYDRTAGEGNGYLFQFNSSGELINAITLQDGDSYHPGGIDFDGEYIWVPVAEYRPNSASIIYKVHPYTLEAIEVFRFSDHIGAVACNPERNILYGYSWGSRRIYTWQLDDTGNLKYPIDDDEISYKTNKQHYIDYQDCQYLGQDRMMCGGVSSYNPATLFGTTNAEWQHRSGVSEHNSERQERFFSLGGLELIDMRSLDPIYQIPVVMTTKGDQPRVMTNNPFYVKSTNNGLRFYFIPEDDESRFYQFEID